MSKCDPLREHLAKQSGYVNLQLDELSKVIPGGLSPFAYTCEAWWNNEDPAPHHCRSWGDVGHRAQVDLARKQVRFIPT